MASRDDGRAREWLAAAWSFEQQAIAARAAAPRPVPNPADGTCPARWARRPPQAAAAARISL
jgi:hypothetical protein